MARRMTAQQIDIIGKLAQGMKRQEIASAVGCDIQTVDRLKADLKKDPTLTEEYYKRCGAEIESLVPFAIKQLGELLNDKSVQGSVRVAAIREVLDRSGLDKILEAAQADIRIEIVYE